MLHGYIPDDTVISVRASFFVGGLSHLCPRNFSTVAEKTAMLTCKITLPDSPSNPGFRAFISVARMNSVFSFNKYKKIFFFHFWLLASARKI